MLCETCGAESPDSATFCQLCLTPFEGALAMSVAPAFAASAPQSAEGRLSEHEWWVERRRVNHDAIVNDLPMAGGTYALAAFDAQERFSRAMWWSASVFTLFAWVATLRAAAFVWAAAVPVSRTVGASVALQSVLIGCVGIAAACVCAVWVSGSHAWLATLVNAFFWVPYALLLASIAVFGGPYSFLAVSAVAAGVVLTTSVAPLRRLRLARWIPKS